MKRLFWNACTDNAADNVLRCLTKRDSGVRTGDVKMNGIEGVASGFAVIADCEYEIDNNVIVLYRNVSRELSTGIDKRRHLICRIDTQEHDLSLLSDASFSELGYLDNGKKHLEVAITGVAHRRFLPPSYYERPRFPASIPHFQLRIEGASLNYKIALLQFFGSVELPPSKMPTFTFFPHERDLAFSEALDRIRILAVSVDSDRELDVQKSRSMIEDYLFNIAYTSGLAFQMKSLIEEEQLRRPETRRVGNTDPMRQYNKELLKHYMQALSSNSPFMQYIAYYHVLEYHFQKLTRDAIVGDIKDALTRPDFSYNNDESLFKLYEITHRHTRKWKEHGVWDERDSLELCLRHFIPDPQKLKHALGQMKGNYVEYYKTTNPAFVDGKMRVDFDDSSDAFYRNLCSRLYSVRCALVHSKDGHKNKYEPFKHDKSLSKEIPLIKSIAEEVIIESGITRG